MDTGHAMNWVDVVWPLIASISLMFGLVHLLIWWVHDRERVHLALAIAAYSLATLTIMERLALFSGSPMYAATVIRWMHVPVAFMIAGLVYTVHTSFGYGAPALAWSVIGLRLLVLVLDFTTGVNLNFLSIDHLEWTTWWGVAVAQPVGTTNPAVVASLASNVVLLVYLGQTLVRGVRLHTARRQALWVVCGASMLLTTVLVGSTFSWIVQFPRLPLTLPSVTVLLLAVGWQLGGDFMRWNRLEGQLRQSEQRRQRIEHELDTAALTSGLGLWQWEVATGTFTQNANNRRLLGHRDRRVDADRDRVESVLADEVEELLFATVEARQLAQVKANFQAAIQQPSYELEYPIISAAGPRRWICLRGSAEHDAQGKPLRVRGLTQDVSLHRSEEEQLRAVLDASPVALLLIDDRDRIRYANARGAAIFGYGRDEISGVAVAPLLPPAAASCPWTADGALADNGPAANDEPVALDRYGRRFPAEVFSNALEFEGRPYTVTAISDLTQKRHAEQEMAVERESLAHMARATLIGELSGSLAHELNQPLAAILSNAQAALRILRRDPGDIDEVREILDDIVENDRRAGAVISRLRSLLKKECRTFTTLAVNDLVHDSLRIIRNDLVNRGVDYRLDLSVPLCRVQGDPIQLQQVLLNLIINACEAMIDASPRVLTLSTCVPSPGRIRIDVRDTGPGIPDGLLETIFAPFHTSKPNGMGMGLAICRTLLRAHGGEVSACNLPAGGASFSFDLAVLE
ncbi:MAG TPA: ATP-binding protein [Stenotrophomonas sp.]